MNKTVIQQIKHTFTAEERAALSETFRGLYKDISVITEEFASVKKSYSAKIAEAEARCTTLSAKLDAGFELRDMTVAVVYDYKAKKKHYYLPEHVEEATGQAKEGTAPLASEDMVASDFQMELLEAEGRFEKRDEIALFNPTENDCGVLVVGRQNGKWYSAIRAKVGGREISERLDAEQPASKQRKDAVARAAKRFQEWLKEALGREVAKGFESSTDAVVEAHKEREE